VPYKQITQLPDNVKNNLPKHAQEIYKEAYNSAEDQYGEEERAHRVAWSAGRTSTRRTKGATGSPKRAKNRRRSE
jgi:cation transport regulator